MQKHFITGIIGLVVGLAAGFFLANNINRGALTAGTPTAGAAPNSPMASMPGTPGDGAMMADVAEVLERAKNDPNNFEAQAEAGDMYSQIGRFDKALEFLVRAAEIKPDDFNANVALANAYFDTRQFENAEKYYTKALTIKPDDINARTDLGTTFVERDPADYERGLKEFNEVLKIDPNHAPTLYNMGVAYFRSGDREGAAKALATLESSNPQSPLTERLRQNITQK